MTRQELFSGQTDTHRSDWSTRATTKSKYMFMLSFIDIEPPLDRLVGLATIATWAHRVVANPTCCRRRRRRQRRRRGTLKFLPTPSQTLQ